MDRECSHGQTSINLVFCLFLFFYCYISIILLTLTITLFRPLQDDSIAFELLNMLVLNVMTFVSAPILFSSLNLTRD